MKKILSLLSVLTISGTTVPTALADYPYQKNNVKHLSGLNWTGLNITKNKRDIKNKKTKHIFKTIGVDIPTQQQIKEKVKQLNPQVNINNINIANITENSAVVTITGFSSQKTINFTIDKSVPINKVIENSNLGEIDINKLGGTYDEQLFKSFLKQLNSQLDINKINVINITTNTAKVKSNDTNIYTGEIDINYSRPVKSVFKNTELSLIIINGANKPTEQEIKNKIKELNNNLENNINNFEVTHITPTSAKISYKLKNILSGEVVAIFISVVNLNNIITQNNLGEFMTENLSNPSEQQIKDKLHELNSQLDINKIKVENITNSSATIYSNNTNTYMGNINVNYSVSIVSLNW